MKKKNFDDFLSTLTHDTIKSLIDDLPEENKHSNFKDILTVSGTISASLSIKLLGLYHDWLFDDSESN